MKIISRDQFEQMIEDAQLIRKPVHKIDGRDTTILTFINNMAEAGALARLQSVSPTICVVDWDGKPSPAMTNLQKENPDLRIEPYSGKIFRKGHKFCLSGHLWSGPIAKHLSYGEAMLKGCVEAAMIDHQLHSYLSNWWNRPGWPEHIARRMDEIYAIYNVLADSASKAVFTGIVKSLHTGEPSYIPASDYFHYFNPVADFSKGDFVFEGGAAGGNYTLEIAKKTGNNGKIICFEPLQKFSMMLKEKTKSLENILVEEYALSDGKRDCFLDTHGEASHLCAHPSPLTQKCRTIDIDSYVEERGVQCNIIKLDIEGSEMACLKGARNTIARYHPLLIISVYHHAGDNFDIPLWIRDNFLGYEMRLGHHSIWHHETVLYAKWRS